MYLLALHYSRIITSKNANHLYYKSLLDKIQEENLNNK